MWLGDTCRISAGFLRVTDLVTESFRFRPPSNVVAAARLILAYIYIYIHRDIYIYTYTIVPEVGKQRPKLPYLEFGIGSIPLVTSHLVAILGSPAVQPNKSLPLKRPASGVTTSKAPGKAKAEGSW